MRFLDWTYPRHDFKRNEREREKVKYTSVEETVLNAQIIVYINDSWVVEACTILFFSSCIDCSSGDAIEFHIIRLNEKIMGVQQRPPMPMA